MLTQDTKRKIDSVRDVLVGKVPDPKAQVEQITTALIYKFMDDMDKGSQELGGKARFFTNGYEKYSWTKLMDPKLGGHDRMDLYVETLSKLSLNPHIPQLFRDIFKDAFLPYRSPETLSLFLKEINGFTYEHSEDLGDSFEYLLSILGSQGDAGQFRTPRHIIDFIVKAIDPKKDESVCDPACGTAGFLISAYKHILKQHDGKDDPENKEKPLTPDERKNLMDHFTGYDISPDMVRLSRVNLYLHGFPNPTIYEYDTLSSEEKWDESFDVMLANPPFMTPKGGIKPHKRFSVQANRSEVLFVDYILEHLRPNGRAGIIVPEGIIFQSANAYKALRKLLVEDGLLAVVSLPSGVFNPYSGVKTGILLFDKVLAKKTQNILFIKIGNDGYGLGAQRREIDKNDLPQALKIIKNYKIALKDDKQFELINDDKKLSHLVAKEKIAESGDYNLSGDRYIELDQFTNPKWPIIELREVTNLQNGYAFKSSDYISESNTLNFRMSNIKPNGTVDIDYNPKYLPDSYADKYKEYLLTDGDVVIAMTDMASDPKILGVPTVVKTGGKNLLLNQRVGKFTGINTERIFIPFLRHILSLPRVRNFYKSKSGGGVQINIGKSDILSIKIPVPPIEVQKEIVVEIEGYQKIITGVQLILDNYRSSVTYSNDLPRVKLGAVCKFEGGTQPPKSTFIDRPKDGYIRLLQIRDYKSEKNAVYIPKMERHKKCTVEDVMIGRYGPPVFQILRGKSGAYNVALMKCVPDGTKLTNDWLYYFLKSTPVQEKIIRLSQRVRQSGVRPDDLNELDIPLPSLEIQKRLVAEAKREEEIITSNHQLIELMQGKIRNILTEI